MQVSREFRCTASSIKKFQGLFLLAPSHQFGIYFSHTKESLLPKETGNIFNTFVLLNVLGTKTVKMLFFFLTYLIKKFSPVIFIFSKSPQNPYQELLLENRSSHANEVNKLLSFAKIPPKFNFGKPKAMNIPICILFSVGLS